MVEQFLSGITNANTRNTYRRGLAYFADWAGDAGVSFETLRVRDIKAFRTHLRDQLGGTSTNVYLSALRAFLRWAAEDELLDVAVAQAASVVGNVEVEQRLPQVLRDEQVADLLCQPDPATLAGARDLAFIALLASSGVRVSEAVGLDLEAVNFREREARVFGKGGKERIILFNTRAAQALQHYLTLRGGVTAGPVFTNRWGERISVRYMQERVAQYGLGLEGGERLHPHTLRHTFATTYLDRTGDVDATSRLLGHARLETTQIYTRLANSRLKAQYGAAMEGQPSDDPLTLELPPARVVAQRRTK